MRVRIEKPCFIESDSPFTIIPIYTSAKAEDPSTWGVSVIQPDTKVQPMAPEGMLPNMPKPKTKRTVRRQRRTCPVCESGYLGSGRSLYCSDRCRHLAYEQHGGSKKAREWALRIRAGATGVNVEV